MFNGVTTHLRSLGSLWSIAKESGLSFMIRKQRISSEAKLL